MSTWTQTLEGHPDVGNLPEGCDGRRPSRGLRMPKILQRGVPKETLARMTFQNPIQGSRMATCGVGSSVKLHGPLGTGINSSVDFRELERSTEFQLPNRNAATTCYGHHDSLGYTLFPHSDSLGSWVRKWSPVGQPLGMRKKETNAEFAFPP